MRKTHLWISLIVGVLVWGAYFAHFLQSLRGEATGGLVWWFLGRWPSPSSPRPSPPA